MKLFQQKKIHLKWKKYRPENLPVDILKLISMRSFIKKYPVSTFFALAILISWAGWIPYAAAQSGILNIGIPSEIIWLAEFGPTLAACLVVWHIYGQSGLKDLRRRLTLWKVNFKWYVFAIGCTPALIMLSLAADRILFATTFDLSLLNAWDINFIKRTEAFAPSMGIITALVAFMKTGALATGITFLVLALTNGGLSEEIGWRGFALQAFQNKAYNLLLSSLLVALLWAFWHTGTLFWQTIMTSGFAGGLQFAVSYLLQYLLLVLPLSVMYSVLYNGTDGSIFLSIILHAFYNISISVFATALPNFPMLTFVILLWIFSIVLIVLLWKKKKFNKSIHQ